LEEFNWAGGINLLFALSGAKFAFLCFHAISCVKRRGYYYFVRILFQ